MTSHTCSILDRETDRQTETQTDRQKDRDRNSVHFLLKKCVIMCVRACVRACVRVVVCVCAVPLPTISSLFISFPGISFILSKVNVRNRQLDQFSCVPLNNHPPKAKPRFASCKLCCLVHCDCYVSRNDYKPMP